MFCWLLYNYTNSIFFWQLFPQCICVFPCKSFYSVLGICRMWNISSWNICMPQSTYQRLILTGIVLYPEDILEQHQKKKKWQGGVGNFWQEHFFGPNNQEGILGGESGKVAINVWTIPKCRICQCSSQFLNVSLEILKMKFLFIITNLAT